MKRPNRFFALILTLALTVGAFVSCGDEPEETPDETPKAEIGSDIGDQAPSFSLEREGSEEKVNIKNYRGKAVVVNFWGTWCTPCKNELPHFSRVAEEYSDSVAVIAVHSVQQRADAPAYIAENFADSSIIFAYDTPRGSYQTDMYFDLLGGTTGYPHTVVLDANGIVTYVHTGIMSYDELKAEVDKALAK